MGGQGPRSTVQGPGSTSKVGMGRTSETNPVLQAKHLIPEPGTANGEPTRILRVIARLNIGGPAIQAVRLSSRLSGHGYQTLLVCGMVSPGEGDMSYLASSEGVSPTILAGFGREISVMDDLRSLRHLRRIIRDFRPHIIHTHTAKAGTLGRLAGLLTKMDTRCRPRFIHTFHGHVFEGYFGPSKALAFLQIERFLARFTDRIVVISPLQYKDICGKYRIAPPEKVRIVPLGFELDRFADAKRRDRSARKELFGWDSEDLFVVGIVGRLTRIKNHRMFLDAVRILKDQEAGARFRFIVVGDGELREELERYSRELGVEKIVLFAGWHQDMVRVYGALDAVVLTSMNEGTPVSLIEAMAAGIPVISTAVGGVPDVLGAVMRVSVFNASRRGLLVHPGEPGELAEAISFLLKNPGASGRMAGRARAYVLKEYTMEKLIENIGSLYMEVIGEGPRSRVQGRRKAIAALTFGRGTGDGGP